MRQPPIAERFSLGASIDKDNGGGDEGGGVQLQTGPRQRVQESNWP